jgi:hypothetical protein
MAQWERISPAMPGLQLITSGEQGTQFMLVCSLHDGSFYEGVIIGQLPHVVMEETGPPHRRRTQPAPDDRKPLERRSIDLDDEQLDQILALWRERKTALSLAFVEAVWGSDGKPHPRSADEMPGSRTPNLGLRRVT